MFPNQKCRTPLVGTVLALAVLLSACVQPSAEAPDVSTSTSQDSQPEDSAWPARCFYQTTTFAVNACTSPTLDFLDWYAYVTTPQANGTLLVAELPYSEHLPRQAQLRIIDADGQVFDRMWDLGTMEFRDARSLPFEYPSQKAPYVVTAACGCGDAWLQDDRDDPDIQFGNRSLVYRTIQLVEVYYGNPFELVSTEPLHDVERVPMDASMIHWNMEWGASGYAHAEWRSPSGHLIGAWNITDRETDANQASMNNMLRPLESGDWTLTFDGYGDMKLYIDRFEFYPHAWETLGINPPAGVKVPQSASAAR